ncbi:MAG: phosphoribosylamine--glycine ligase [Elusimicrobiota bacterium]
MTEKILLIGSWAKEQITIENIKQSSTYRVFCYLSTKNPGILKLADGYKIGSLSDNKNIIQYARDIKPDLVLITTASPLSNGLTDVLERAGFSVFAPSKQAARLEIDKAYARNILKEIDMDIVPKFGVFKKIEKGIEFAGKLNWDVAVKPVGLTEGLGVKVSDEQLKTKEDIKNYIREILNKKISGKSKVLIEKKLTGEEFTIQCLAYDGTIIPTPAVQDFKKLKPNDKGPNTASMGSYSDTKKILPFLTPEEYRYSLKIIQKTVNYFTQKTGKDCRGFLYGQFILTPSGIKVVEYNFRPGDPEWMNTLTVLKDNIADKIFSLMKGNDIKLNFKNRATVCKYIVPRDYPRKLYQELDIAFPEDKLKDLGVNFYYSGGIVSGNRLNVGKERGVAFIGQGNSIAKANNSVEKAISLIKGNFRYRCDIGSEKLINSKKKYVREAIR